MRLPPPKSRDSPRQGVKRVPDEAELAGRTRDLNNHVRLEQPDRVRLTIIVDSVDPFDALSVV